MKQVLMGPAAAGVASREISRLSDHPSVTEVGSHPGADVGARGWERHARRGAEKNRVLVVEDESTIRESLGDLLEDEGYEVSFAENGEQALSRLRSGVGLPDIIVLDLRMPVMDGWEFRAIQKDDPALGYIPVVAVSADRSAPAVTISAQAYLQKPLDVSTLLRTIERILFDSERRQMSARLEEAERLASLGRVAAGVGHEINNPLTFAILNLNQSLIRLKTMDSDAANGTLMVADGEPFRERLALLNEMLGDCQVGLERIRQTVSNLQRLSRHGRGDQGPLDVRQVLEESISMAWNQIRHRARLVKNYAVVPAITGNGAALGQVFLNMLVNAAQSIAEGDAERHQITVSTFVRDDDEVVVEIGDTGKGIEPEILAHVFEPFFTTKPVGVGTGLGLSISRQTVTDHGGRIEVESDLNKGTTFRVVLPVAVNATAPVTDPEQYGKVARPVKRARVLVIDDEVAIGRVVVSALSAEHDVVVLNRATDAFVRFQAGERFDLVLCDVLMPVVSGPEVYATIKERWPDILPNLVFMTGGAFTPATAEFIGKAMTPILPKPFQLSELAKLIEERVGVGITSGGESVS
ncbi:MAG: response regulator [Myxococcales bacterium]